MTTEEAREEIRKRVEWWITDFHFKPPEVTTDAYWRMMAEEIADHAIATCAALEGDTPR